VKRTTISLSLSLLSPYIFIRPSEEKRREEKRREEKEKRRRRAEEKRREQHPTTATTTTTNYLLPPRPHKINNSQQPTKKASRDSIAIGTKTINNFNTHTTPNNKSKRASTINNRPINN